MRPTSPTRPSTVSHQLRALEDARQGRHDRAARRRARSASPTSRKIFWPKLKLTKGDLLRYYATVAPFILPAVADRPLVMKRFPNGVDGPAFYQQRSRLEKPPAGVRIETTAGRHRSDLRARRAALHRRIAASRCST